MYTARIKNKLTINKKDGKVKLDRFEVDVNGYKEPRLLEEAKESYNSGKDVIQTNTYYSNDWPKGVWHDLYQGMWKNLLKWKRKRIYKKD
jgi:methionine synthase I (cobalamin-dependent)